MIFHMPSQALVPEGKVWGVADVFTLPPEDLSPLCLLPKTRVRGRTYKIGRGRRWFFGTSRLLGWCVRLCCRMACPSPLRVCLARIGCPAGCSVPLPGWGARLRRPNCFVPASLLAASARPPGWLARLHQPTSWLGPASLLAGSTRQAGCLARFRWPTGWLGFAARLAESDPQPGWLTRHGNSGWLDRLPCWLVNHNLAWNHSFCRA